MPGFHLLASIKNAESISPEEKRKFSDTLNAMRHFQFYINNVLLDDSKILLGRSYYEGYPFTVFQDENGSTIVEGAIYNKSDELVEKELREFSLSELSNDQLLQKIKHFVLSTTGEFIVVKYEKNAGKCLVFNDALGRLPFYYSSSSDGSSDKIIMSREVKFIIPFLDKTNWDKTALAEYLLLGYPLGEKTFLEDVKRLSPAAMMLIDLKNNNFVLESALSWNLDPKIEEINIQEETRKLADLLLDSSNYMKQKLSPKYIHVVSMSGGLDSRATLAGLVNVGANPIAYSFPAGENRIAQQVAQELGTTYHVLLSNFDISNEDYVKLTDGLIDIGLTSLIPFLYGLRQELGNNVILYTGDGGDKTAGRSCVILNSKNVRTLEQLLEYILENEHVFDIDAVSSLLNLPDGFLREHIRQYIADFPEKTIEGKFTHFKILGRAFKWSFLGEDRNRFFLWSTTPFYSVEFFSAAMKVPQAFKDHWILYKNFLSCLNPVLPKIRYYDRLVPLSLPDWLLISYVDFFEGLRKRYYKPGTTNPVNVVSRRIVQADGARAQVVDKAEGMRSAVLDLLNTDKNVKFLDPSQTRKIIKTETNQVKLNTLATLIIYAGIIKNFTDQ
jgi:asparagine synthase (glutamine-hydrolysing)